MRWRGGSSRGTWLVEFGITLPVLGALVFGAVDLNRYFAARQALEEAGKKAARCVYPTDPDCVTNVAPPTPNKLFDWFTVVPTWGAPMMDVSGSVQWLDVPVKLWQASTNVISGASYNYTETVKNVVPVMGSNWQATRNYLVRVGGFPSVSGNNPNSPNISGGNKLGGVTHSNTGSGGGAVYVAPGASDDVIYIDFRVPRPSFSAAVMTSLAAYSKFECFSPNSSPGGQPIYESGYKCKNSLPKNAFDMTDNEEITTATFIAFRIAGHFTVSGSGSSGVPSAIDLDLKVKTSGGHYTSVGSVGDMGGQAQTAPTTDNNNEGNFWIRGMPGKNNQKNDSQLFFDTYNPDGSSSSSDGFHPGIKVLYDRDYRIVLKLFNNGNAGHKDVGYEIDSVDIWHPVYEERQVTLPCSSGITAQIGTNVLDSQCNATQGTKFVASVPSDKIKHTTTFNGPPIGSYTAYDWELGKPAETTKQQNIVNSQTITALSSYNFPVASSVPKSQPGACPAAPNGGNTGFNMPIAASTVRSICPAPAPASSAPTTHWNSSNLIAQTQQVTPVGTVSWTKDCQESPPGNYNFPALAPYTAINWTDLTGPTPLWQQIGTGINPPSSSPEATDPNNVCATVHKVDISGGGIFDNAAGGASSMIAALPPGSPFGEHYLNGCPGYTDTIKSNATAAVQGAFSTAELSMPANPYVSVALTPSGTVSTSTCPISQASHCVDCAQETSGFLTKLTSAPLPEGITPSECSDPANICTSTFAGYAPMPPPPAPGVNHTNVKMTAWQHFASAVPGAQLGCSGKNCLTVNVVDDGSSSNNVDLALEYQMPLFLLGNKTLKLSKSFSHQSEAKFLQ